jgi:Ca2+-transporting ATPase
VLLPAPGEAVAAAPAGSTALAQSLTGLQWLACIGLAFVMPIVVEIDKWVHRRRQRPPGPVQVEVAVAPARATVAA